MEQLTAPVTSEEYKIFFDFCLEKGIDTEDDNNGVKFADILVNRNQRINRENLDAVYPGIQNQLTHLDPVKADFQRLAIHFTAPARDAIAAFIGQQGLDVGEHLLSNWNILAGFLIENKATSTKVLDEKTKTFKTYAGNALPPSPENLQYALRSIQSSPQNQHLVWKQQQAQQRRFDSAAAQKEYDARKASREAGQNIDQRDPSQAVVTYTDEHGNWVRPLSGELKAHQEQVHAAMASKDKDQQTQADDPGAYYKQRSLDLLNSIQSNVDRQDATNKFVQHGHSGAWPWKVVFTSLSQWVELRKYQRSVAGR
jgi:hypothetical protein